MWEIDSPSTVAKKRRSKHDLEGRSFKCEKCAKCYLSYPALYTHVKTKHENEPLPTKGIRSSKNKPKNSNSNPPISKVLADTKFSEFFEKEERKGETLNIKETFIKVIFALNKILPWGLNNPEEHVLIRILDELLKDRNSMNLGKTCDYVLVEYCLECANLSNPEYFEVILRIILSYRECANKYGWQKMIEETKKITRPEPFPQEGNNSPRIETCFKNEFEDQLKMQKEYCATCNPDRLSEMSNEFILIFCKQYDIGIAEHEAINIVMNFCEWLFTKKYTNTMVTLIKGK